MTRMTPTCPLCGEAMREERGMERANAGLVERWWSCPRCLHRMATVDEWSGQGRREEGGRECTSM